MKYLPYLPHGLFFAFVTRLIIKGASIGDAIALLSLASIYGYYLFLESNKLPEVNQEFKDRLTKVEKLADTTSSKIGLITMGGKR